MLRPHNSNAIAEVFTLLVGFMANLSPISNLLIVCEKYGTPTNQKIIIHNKINGLIILWSFILLIGQLLTTGLATRHFHYVWREHFDLGLSLSEEFGVSGRFTTEVQPSDLIYQTREQLEPDHRPGLSKSSTRCIRFTGSLPGCNWPSCSAADVRPVP